MNRHLGLLFLALLLLTFLGGLGIQLAGKLFQHGRGPNAEAAPQETPEQVAAEVAPHREAFRALVRRVQDVAPACTTRDTIGEIPAVKGKALIWDGPRNDVSEAHYRLPADVRARTPTEPVTVFLIAHQDRKHYINYERSLFQGGGGTGVKGFCVYSYLCVLDGPQQPLGRFQIVGADPPWVVSKLEPGQTEVEGFWKGRMAHWVEGCVRGPAFREQREQAERRKETHQITPKGQEGYDQLAAQAKAVLKECEALGSAGPIPPLPEKVLLWSYEPTVARVDKLSETQQHLPANRRASPTDTEVVVIIMNTCAFVEFERNGRPLARTDHTFAVIALPGPRPVGVFTYRGVEFMQRAKSWPDSNAEILGWVTQLLDAPQTLVNAKARPHLRLKPAGYEESTDMARQAEAAVDGCFRLGAALPVGKLPPHVLVWDVVRSCRSRADNFGALLSAAGPESETATVFLLLKESYVPEQRGSGVARYDYIVAVVKLPGPVPVGLYTVRGEDWPAPRTDKDWSERNLNKALGNWVLTYMESPAAAIDRAGR